MMESLRETDRVFLEEMDLDLDHDVMVYFERVRVSRSVRESVAEGYVRDLDAVPVHAETWMLAEAEAKVMVSPGSILMTCSFSMHHALNFESRNVMFVAAL